MEELLNGARILLCEDDENLGMLLREYLEQKDYHVDLCIDGEEGFNAFNENQYDLGIFDVMMPKMDGFTLATKIRESESDIPIIFLTAKTLKEDVKHGFEIGADDYITKPFSMEELVFRIEAILRRVRGKKTQVTSTYNIGRFVFDVMKQTLTIDGHQKRLTTKETDLLRLLASKEGDVLERDYALRAIWIDDNFFNARSMDVYITKLRKLLKDDPEVEIINVHGKGYRLAISEGK